jgi:ketosteroid isomerase-like protein
MQSSSLVTGLALALTVAACQPAAEAPATLSEEDEAAIQGILDSYAANVRAQDWATLVTYYADDAVRMPPNEPMQQGRAAIMAWLEAQPPVTGFTLTPQLVSGRADLAYARGTFTFDLAPPDAEPVSMIGKWHAIYERQADGSWLCVSDIWNTDAPVPM